ncbi:DNA helicase IV [Methylohalomonas lacus]|uniref:DNA 3'-5' helicase II n=1 Tax=Methylohalomonas lacus TaxID=398773 RepID=A0AAE3HKQ3_9GAMM|nr:AAA family ATPase [Methylohalomonas lacus]MCS3902192.1 DNA helicase IV [Methylohalomonas lacus]
MNAPLDGAILVTGPPGSGKTVMAYYRCEVLAQRKQSINLLMYNRVLRKYVGESNNKHVDVDTMETWLGNWWRKAFNKGVPRQSNQGGSRYSPIDWDRVLTHALENSSNKGIMEKLKWGHLVIDEGQDFPMELYRVMYSIGMAANPGNEPCITVFADDNQQLNEALNATTWQIRKSLCINKEPKRNLSLTKNYRNTLQIHNFSTYYKIFEAEADPPQKEGELPTARIYKSDSDCMDNVTRLCRLSTGKEIGIIVQTTKRRVKQIYNKISTRLKSSNFKIQAYMSGDRVHSDSALTFDTNDTITIVHTNSAKGLEFDVVFLMDMQDVGVHDDRLEQAAKSVYMLSSRAREQLHLCYLVDEGDELPESIGLLPPFSNNLYKVYPNDYTDKVNKIAGSLELPRHT